MTSFEDQAARAHLKDAVSQQTVRHCLAKYRDSLRAIVLTGSLARDEATFVRDESAYTVLGDAEFLLVFNDRLPLPPAPGLRFLERQIERGLAGWGISGPINLSAAHPDYLRELAPHIYGYELRVCGQVVWGDSGILSLIPPFCPSDIPLEDAWRLLMNRMIEQLEVLKDVAWGLPVLSRQGQYRTVKLCLDMATSLLVFNGVYAPTYGARQQAVELLARQIDHEVSDYFSLGSFARLVRASTDWKLSAGSVTGMKSPQFWHSAMDYARLLWRWELARLTEARSDATDDDLRSAWMRRQPFQSRLRGWMAVLRKCGWHRSWRQWARWGRLAWRGSPRYWIYAAASELFFILLRLLECDDETAGTSAQWETLNSWLPVVRSSKDGAGEPAWQRLADDILWNYREFLVETRA